MTSADLGQLGTLPPNIYQPAGWSASGGVGGGPGIQRLPRHCNHAPDTPMRVCVVTVSAWPGPDSVGGELPQAGGQRHRNAGPDAGAVGVVLLLLDPPAGVQAGDQVTA